MKQYRVALTIVTKLILSLAVILVSCTKQEPIDVTLNGNEIVFEMGLTPITKVSTGIDFTSQWEDGDEIGVFAVKREKGQDLDLQPIDNHFHNIKVTYTESTPGDPTTGTWSIDNGENLYWPVDGSVLDFYAYYPYNDNNGSPETLDPTDMNCPPKVGHKTLGGILWKKKEELVILY